MGIYYIIIGVMYFHHKYMMFITVVLGSSSGYRKEKEMAHIPKGTWPKDTLHVGCFH